MENTYTKLLSCPDNQKEWLRSNCAFLIEEPFGDICVLSIRDHLVGDARKLFRAPQDSVLFDLSHDDNEFLIMKRVLMVQELAVEREYYEIAENATILLSLWNSYKDSVSYMESEYYKNNPLEDKSF